ncbi:sodium:solute symporter family protein [Myxococcota bacterium]|nr:sodium:solute symporter family protein [Myxococcota bacterium]
MSGLLVALIVYVGLQLAIGLFVSRRVATESDYLIAGRRLGPVLVTFSMFATWFGAETCIGAAGAVYARGFDGATADPFAYAGCLFLLGAVFAVPLWRRGLTTIGDLFAQRFGSGVERLAVLLMAPTSVLWAAAQIRAFGHVVATSSGIELEWALALAAAVVILYTAAGGLLSDAVTDVLQGSLLAVGLVVLAIAVLARDDVSLAGLLATGGSFAPVERSLLERAEAWAIPLFGSLIAQEQVARVLSARSGEVARGSAFAAGGLYLAIGIVPVGLALVGVRLLPGLEDPEQVLPRLALEHFPAWFYVVFAGALISAILSTVDSALLAASSLVAHNLLAPLRPGASDRTKLRLARGAVLVFGIVAYGLAREAEGVYALIESASAFASAGVLVSASFGLFTRIGGAFSAGAALVSGALVWMIGAWGGLIEAPYLASIAAATLAYVAGAFVEAFRR